MTDLTKPSELGGASADRTFSFQLKLSVASGPEALTMREPQPDDLLSLRLWLRDDAHVGEHVVTRPGGEQSPGQMGSVTDTILAFADGGLETLGLVVAILAWRDSRPRELQHTVTIVCGDVTVEITGQNPELIEQIRRLLNDGKA